MQGTLCVSSVTHETIVQILTPMEEVVENIRSWGGQSSISATTIYDFEQVI